MLLLCSGLLKFVPREMPFGFRTKTCRSPEESDHSVEVVTSDYSLNLPISFFSASLALAVIEGRTFAHVKSENNIRLLSNAFWCKEKLHSTEKPEKAVLWRSLRHAVRVGT